ncbi:MAG: hypothetical protein J0H70_10600 [Microbacterium chocolatum]|nr:hypothetical protein [Microbacterium chocolatum]
MTKKPTTRRRNARRSRRIRVTTQTDEQSTVRLAQILTSAALQKALLEAEAAAEHASRTARSSDLASAEGRLNWPGEGLSRA